MSKLRIRAALACRIVNLDRVKFNDAVASGTYPCAPSTIKGSARLFTPEELVPLYFFARLMEFGIPAGRAGHLACKMASCAEHEFNAGADRIILLRGTITETFVPSQQIFPEHMEEEPKVYDPQHEKNGSYYPSLGRILFTVEFYISHVRQIIAAAIEEERNTLGPEDE